MLHDVSFSVDPGERVVVLGSSGDGKTTLADLLLGFIEPTSGAVRLDGRSTTELDLEWLRSVVGYLTQFPQILDGETLRTQVALDRTDVEPETFDRITTAVGLGAVAASLPLGWDTPVTAAMLSGGERELIALARVLLADKPVLVFDEALVGIDPEAKLELQALIERITEGKTVLWITHSLPPSWADRVIVLQKGAIVEDGTPQELANRPGGVLAERIAAEQERLDELRGAREALPEKPRRRRRAALAWVLRVVRRAVGAAGVLVLALAAIVQLAPPARADTAAPQLEAGGGAAPELIGTAVAIAALLVAVWAPNVAARMRARQVAEGDRERPGAATARGSTYSTRSTERGSRVSRSGTRPSRTRRGSPGSRAGLDVAGGR